MSRIGALVESLLALEPPLLVALDVDGTISPIARDPDSAQIPIPTLSNLEALARGPGVELALITGRTLSSLAQMEQLDGIWRAVEHGGLVLAPGQAPAARELSRERREALAVFQHWVETYAQDAFVEYKPQAIAVHVRAIAKKDPARAARLLGEADELARNLGLHVRHGKALREAEAIHHDKGSALGEIFERSGASSVFFAGDDLTDFSAIEFAALHGVGAFVCSDEQEGAPPASAALLRSVDEMAQLLGQLADRIPG
ncbi:MAG: trehalose-phosphatase [Myxococcales bacterium]|nr:trehalose-phosphatase [Myxococcales bacterium]